MADSGEPRRSPRKHKQKSLDAFFKPKAKKAKPEPAQPPADGAEADGKDAVVELSAARVSRKHAGLVELESALVGLDGHADGLLGDGLLARFLPHGQLLPLVAPEVVLPLVGPPASKRESDRGPARAQRISATSRRVACGS